jgi:hypothetical protein
MNCAKLFTLFGLALDCLGVCFLLWNEWQSRKKESLRSDVPGNPALEDFNAAIGDKTRAVTEPERVANAYETKLSPKKSLCRTVIGWILVILGFVLQFIGTLIS